MKRLLTLLFVITSLGLYAQNDLPNNCLDCATAGGIYCGDDTSNWTVYSPNGCVPSFYINDGSSTKLRVKKFNLLNTS